MSLLPDRPDLRQLRTQAKELRRALAEGDPVAFDRVLKSHPKLAGRSTEDIKGHELSLRDAQVSIAREHGFESWRDLVSELEGDQVGRWRERHYGGALGRAFNEARDLSHSHATLEHICLALLAPPEPTIAQRVLEQFGFTHEAWAERTKRLHKGLETDKVGTSSTPVYHTLSGFAQGIALGLGAADVTDEHVLLAILYSDAGYEGRMVGFEVETDEVISALKERGVTVPQMWPPVPATPIGPFGQYVYFPEGDWSAVSQAITNEFPPPDAAKWGIGRSEWKEGYWYVSGEDVIPLERLVKAAVTDPRRVEVVPTNVAYREEQKAKEAKERGSDD